MRRPTADANARKHVEELAQMGEAFLTHMKDKASERPQLNPHKLSLSVSAARIWNFLKVMALGAVGGVLLMLLWNILFR